MSRPTNRELLEQLLAEVAELRAEVADYAEQANMVRDMEEIRVATRVRPAPRPAPRRHLRLATGAGQ